MAANKTDKTNTSGYKQKGQNITQFEQLAHQRKQMPNRPKAFIPRVGYIETLVVAQELATSSKKPVRGSSHVATTGIRHMLDRHKIWCLRKCAQQQTQHTR